MTARGVSSPLKDALLARFPHVRAAFNQPAFIESLNLPHQVLADIWLPVGFPPVSFEPLNEEEEKVGQSGQFTNVNVRTRNNPNNPNYSYSNSGDYRTPNNRGRGGMESGPGRQQSNRPARGGYAPANSRYSSNDRPNHHHNYEDETIEDPDNLWATPSADAIGSSDFGSFDANGMFKTGATDSILDGGIEDVASSSAAFEGFMQTRPHHAPAPIAVPSAPIAPVSSAIITPSSPPVAIPHITPDTQWVYRDPSGQIQGPFPSHRMMEWYNGKYFPENLPLRRENDPFFEPLSTWKSKCAGQIPFGAYTKAPEKPAVAPIVPECRTDHFSERRSESISMSQWFSEPVKAEPAVVAKIAEPVAPATSSPQTRSVPLASLFGNMPTTTTTPLVSIEKPGSPEVMMPSAAAGWKKLDKPSVSAKFGQMELESEAVESHITSTPVTSTSVPVPVTAHLSAPSVTIPATKPALVPEFTEVSRPVQSSLSSSASWSSTSSAALKKISLSEIMKSSEEPNIILETYSQPIVTSTSSNNAGWAKISASPVQSLSTIQAIQAEEVSARQRSASTSSSAAASSASKSFAELVRSAGVITLGDIVVSPSVVDRAPLVNEHVKPSTIVKPLKSFYDAPAPVPVTAAPVSVTATPATVTVSIDDWCINSLKQSSLSKSIDPQTCTILLLDLPNPAALLSFSLETLKPLESAGTSFDLAAFVQELSSKKFGAKATDKVQWSKLKSVPQVKKQEESFEVVKRKK